MPKFFAFEEALKSDRDRLPKKKYDGCTGFPDGYWVRCCDEHDESYEKGGTWRMRRNVDRLFRCCVDDSVYLRTGSKARAILQSWAMYLGVRVMGSPWCLPLYLWPRWRNQARWGFGAR